jgi:Holliday junction resolvase RusA-like endonuclease
MTLEGGSQLRKGVAAYTGGISSETKAKPVAEPKRKRAEVFDKRHFTVYLKPVPQPRPRISMRGGFARAYTPSDHPVVPYRAAVVAAALKAASRKEWARKTSGRRVRLEVWCVFQRPKSHYKAGGALKDDAPLMPRPDVDNLVKAIMDAMKDAGVWSDDVVCVDERCRKRYVSARIEPHVTVFVW